MAGYTGYGRRNRKVVKKAAVREKCKIAKHIKQQCNKGAKKRG